MGLVEYQDRIRLRLHSGGSLDQVERDLIDRSPFSEEQRAALWLFAAAVARSQAERPAAARHDPLSRSVT